MFLLLHLMILILFNKSLPHTGKGSNVYANVFAYFSEFSALNFQIIAYVESFEKIKNKYTF